MPKEKSCSQRLIGMAITLGILGGGAYGMWWWLGKPDVKEAIRNFDLNDFTNVLGNLTDFAGNWNTDPFVGDNSTNPWTSSTSGEGGLTLALENACDDAWTDEFQKAVDDWDNGNPDALTLSTARIDIDRECTQKRGVMKVCNANYGETGWLGINEMALNGQGAIVSSVAKMNEFYLLNAKQEARQYTMCHEIGHGFGLPHTDENFNNADLGNCLDYTSRPQNNQLPGQVNFDKLKALYGEVGSPTGSGTRRGLRRVLNQIDGFTQDETRTFLEERDALFADVAAVHAHRRMVASGTATMDQEMPAANTLVNEWEIHSFHERGAHVSKKLSNGYFHWPDLHTVLNEACSRRQVGLLLHDGIKSLDDRKQ